MSETQHAPPPDACVWTLGFAGFSECFKSHESAAFLESTGSIFQVPLNPTYVVKSVLCWDLSIRGTSALRLEETFSVRVMFNRTHVIILLKSQAPNGSMPRDCRAAVCTILYLWLFHSP